jgi:histidinol-phosphate aminotransferase
VLVRHFDKPRAAPYLRITVGTEDDTRRLIEAVATILR